VPELPPGTQYVVAAAGDFHTVLIRSDGDAVAFGRYDHGQCDVPELPPGTQYVVAAAGRCRTILIRSDGDAVAFGRNGYGQCDVPELPPGTQYVVAAAGDFHTVLIRSDGDAVAFGWNDYGQCDVPELPPGTQYVDAAAGEEHTVLIRSDGDAVAFGCYGQCDVPELPPGRRCSHNTEMVQSGPPSNMLMSPNSALHPKRRSVQRTLWSPQLHAHFPESSRGLVMRTMLLQSHMHASGIDLAPKSCLISHILPFLVPVILRGPWASREERIVSTAASRTVEQNGREGQLRSRWPAMRAVPFLPHSIIQRVSHGEPAAAISPAEAEDAQQELWASGVEMVIASDLAQASSVERFLLLTFNRLTQELERSLLGSPLASRVANPMPDWASGAKIFAALDKETLLELLPTGHVLRPWNVVIREADEQALLVAISQLPEDLRRLKSVVGRLVLHTRDFDSVQANPDAGREIPELQVMNGFVHFLHGDDVRSTRTA